MANQIEDIGVYHVAEIAARNNWMFRPQPVDDVGIDAHMEFTDKFGNSRQLLALQVKAGSSWFNEEKDGYYIFRKINERQYNYWTTNTLPCILVIYNPDDDTCIWQKLTTTTIEKTGSGNGYIVKVPKNQVFLDANSNSELLSFSKLPEHVTNYNFLLSQKKFMQIIQEGGDVKLHSKEWINKCSGRGEIELIVDDGTRITKYSYPYWFPFTPYPEVFSKLFPWANFIADEAFFEDSDFSLWHELHCYHDDEDGEWIVVGESYQEFRRNLEPMRYIDHYGEVAEYMMKLSLNDLGKAFLCVDSYVSLSVPYASARPESEAGGNEGN